MIVNQDVAVDPELEFEVVEDALPALSEKPAALRRRVLGLAWPVIGENLLETLLGIVDTWLVGGLSTAAVAGVGTGLQIMFFLLAALSALSVGSSILVAQAIGAVDPRRANQIARQSLVWSVLLSVPLAVVGLALAHPLIGLFGMSPEVTRIGADYFRVTMGTVVVLVALTIGGGVLRGAGDSRTPMVVTAIANVLNVALAFGLIYGRFGLPAMGAVGSAWATFFARAVALALMLFALWKGRNGITITGKWGWRPDWSVAREVLKLGVPASVEQLVMASAFLVLTVLVARLGTDTFAAMRISMSALSLSFLPGFGFGMAATALVGQSIGAQRPQLGAGIAQIATTWAVLWMSTMGAFIFLFAEPIMHLFIQSPHVAQIGAQGLRIVALTQPFWAIGMVQSGALRGTSDTRTPLLISSVGMWATVLLVWLGLKFVGGGLGMFWGAFLITSPVTAGMTWWCFRRRVRELEAS